jgi:5-methylcytosine-specific restriction endonuclease McrA
MRERQGRRCTYCARHESELGRRLDVHRLVPEDKGGRYEKENVVVVCQSCHLRLERWVGAL